ncbi:MAG TPA: rhodanese-like domain-containing protein [Blastocatellia bacterium]|nr:rhodanese-like domain-containing protein [Blastocatellia bacterium]
MRLNKTILATAIGTLLVLASFVQAAGPRAVVSHNGVSGVEDNAKHGISAKDLKARLDKREQTVIIDARSNLGGEIIKGAIHVPADKLDEWAASASKTMFVVTYCTCPHDEAADAAVHKLRALGFENAFSLSGGLNAARTAGLDVVAPETE